jgi:hypothetical protein
LGIAKNLPVAAIDRGLERYLSYMEVNWSALFGRLISKVDLSFLEGLQISKIQEAWNGEGKRPIQI